MLATTENRSRNRADIADAHKWLLDDIYPTWPAWETALAELERRIGEYAALKGTLGRGPDQLLAAYRLNDELGQLAYKVYFYPSLKYDEDQRDNQVNARRQQVQALMARWQEATSWLSPELLAIPIATVRRSVRRSNAGAKGNRHACSPSPIALRNGCARASAA